MVCLCLLGLVYLFYKPFGSVIAKPFCNDTVWDSPLRRKERSKEIVFVQGKKDAQTFPCIYYTGLQTAGADLPAVQLAAALQTALCRAVSSSLVFGWFCSTTHQNSGHGPPVGPTVWKPPFCSGVTVGLSMFALFIRLAGPSFNDAPLNQENTPTLSHLEPPPFS